MKKPDINVSVGGYDCTGDPKSWTATDFRKVAAVFLEAAVALENKMHGCIEEPELVHVGIDFGGEFSEETGLPAIPRKAGT